MAAQEIVGQNWIDRYVAEVGRMVPASKRADVQMEIRSLIGEEVEARVAEGSPADESTVLAVLARFGRPQAMAAHYGATQYLIGPSLYPTFITVLRVVLGIVAVVTLILLAIAIGVSGERPDIWGFLGDFFGGLFQAAGTVVVIFAIIERLNHSALEKMAETPWNPRSLPAVEDRDRVKVGEMVVGIAFTVAALLVLNFYLDDVGRYYVAGEGWRQVPIFSDAFRAYVPWLTLWWGSDLILNIVVLIRGRWGIVTRLVHVTIQSLGIVVLLQMLTGPALTDWPVLEPAFNLTLGIILAVTGIEVAKTLWALVGRALSGRSPAPTTPVTR